MRKRFLAIPIIIAALLVLMGLAAPNIAKAYSRDVFEELTFNEIENATTIITDTEGEEHTFDGALDFATIEGHECVEKIASYELLLDGESVLSVTLHDIIVDEDLKTELEEAALAAELEAQASEDANAEAGSEAGEDMSLDEEPILQTPMLFNAPMLLMSPPPPIESKTLNGYYAIRFKLNDGNKVMFLTGLTAANVGAVQNEIFNSYATQSAFQFENVDFIDAEKNGDMDTNFCWAAAACNVLQYTGWADAMTLPSSFGFSKPYTTDDLMDVIVSSFTKDEGGFARCAFAWFLNGCKGWDMKYTGSTKTQPKDDCPGAFVAGNNYAYDMVATFTQYNKNVKTATEKFAEDMQRLENGYGVDISVQWEFEGAHALSMWGYIYDTTYTSDQKEYYCGIALTDSDSDKVYDGRNRRTIVNKLTVATLTPTTKNYDSWVVGFNEASRGTLSTVQTIMPYSATLQKETSAAATRDKHTTIDLVCPDLHFNDDASSFEDYGNKLSNANPLYIIPEIENLSDVDFAAKTDVLYKIEVIDSSDNVVFSTTETKSTFLTSYSLVNGDRSKVTPGGGKEVLDPGTYTVRMTVDPDNSIVEAYEYNNVYEETITIIPNPLGDATISGTAGEFTEYYAPITLTHSGAYLDIAGHTYSLYASFLQPGGEWSAYEGCQSEPKVMIYDVDEVPTKCIVRRNGSKVKFKLVVNDNNVKSSLESEPVDLNFFLPKIDMTANNVENPTPIAHGAKKFNAGEKKEFVVKNLSTKTTPLTMHMKVGYFENGYDGDFTAFIEKDLTLNKDEASGPIGFSEWTQDIEKSRSIYVVLTYEEGGVTITTQAHLGSINMLELPSTVVTFAGDEVNATDNRVSLREAIAYAKTLGEHKITFDESMQSENLGITSTMSLDYDVEIDGLYIKDGKENLIRVTNYCNTPNMPMFKVAKGKTVTARGLRMEGYFSYDTQFVFDNGGGTITFDKCFFENSTNRVGDYIFCFSNGTTNFRSCFFQSLENKQGAIFEVKKGGTANFLNCQMSTCEGTGAVMLNDGGVLNLVYCALLSNPVLNNIIYHSETTSGESGMSGDGNLPPMDEPGYAVVFSKDGSTTNALGCTVLKPDPLLGKYSFGGNVKIMNCLYNNVDDNVILDSDSKAAVISDAYECEMGYFKWEINSIETARYRVMGVPLEDIAEKAPVKREGNKLLYKTGIGNWVDSGIAPAFEAADYTVDTFDNDHRGFYGAVALVKAPGPEPEPEPTPVPVDTGDHNNMIIYIIIAGVCVAAIIVAVIVLVSKKKKKTDDEE